MEILFCWKKRRKACSAFATTQSKVIRLTFQADKRFFTMLKKHFDSIVVEDDQPGEREVYQREGVTLLRLKRRK